MNKCDIIIPVYNAYECLKPCIDSVIKNTNLEKNRIILINDASSDKRVLPLLKKYADNKKIILLENKINLGFVRTVNKGMKYSKNNDVLLLNSDTEVTKKWLEKIKECAYFDDKVATVTPLSNNATLASIPKNFIPNNLPKNITLDEMSDFVEKTSSNSYPEIPTGHGFCLYIKRSVLEKVGFFDEESFGKGYGEENDFCYRCIDYGYKNILCDNTYILHKESQSFKNSKIKLIESGLKKLDERYPNLRAKTNLWINKNPIEYIGEKVAISIGTNVYKPNVLFAIHDWKNVPNNIGGTTMHVWDIIKNLREYFNFHVLSPEDGIYKVYSYWSNGLGESKCYFNAVESFGDYELFNFEYKAMINQIIEMYKINILHVHHMINNYFDIIDAIENKKIYKIFTIHDYYPICPLINKLYQNRTYCGDPDIDKCSNCIKICNINKLRSTVIISNWRKTWNEYLNKFDMLITPSESSKKEILKTYPNLNIKVIEHGVDLKKYSLEEKIESKYFDVAFIGGIGIHKGFEILKRISKMSFFGKKIKIHLFGTSLYPLKDNKYFVNHGKYEKNDLPRLLRENNIKLICLFSIWPETYSYTLTESIACGVPVLSYDIGAIAERISKNDFGWTIPLNSSYKDIKKKIINIKNNKEDYIKKISAIKKYKIKSTKLMSKEYKELYQKHMYNDVRKIDSNELFENVRNTRANNTIVVDSSSWVFSTLKWKIISKIKIPKNLKKIFKKIRNKEN